MCLFQCFCVLIHPVYHHVSFSYYLFIIWWSFAFMFCCLAVISRKLKEAISVPQQVLVVKVLVYTLLKRDVSDTSTQEKSYTQALLLIRTGRPKNHLKPLSNWTTENVLFKYWLNLSVRLYILSPGTILALKKRTHSVPFCKQLPYFSVSKGTYWTAWKKNRKLAPNSLSSYFITLCAWNICFLDLLVSKLSQDNEFQAGGN